MIEFNSRLLKKIGYAVGGLGMFLFLQENFTRFYSSVTFNIGYNLAETAILIMGMITIAVSCCFETIEKKIASILDDHEDLRKDA